MGDVVRPNFHLGMRVDSKGSASSHGVPQKVYGEVGCYRVQLHHDSGGGRYPLYKLMLLRLDTNEIHSLALLPASQTGHFEAHAIAAAVLQALRLTTSPR